MNSTNLVENLGLKVTLIEPNINREASTYINDHYFELIKYIKALGIIDKATDLLADVAVSILTDENEGEGYDAFHESREDSGIMMLKQFILLRIQGYAKNIKYSSDKIEQHNSYVITKESIKTEKLDKNGKVMLDKNGNVKYESKVIKRRVLETCTAYAATFNESGNLEEDNDSFQKAYAMASIADSTDEIDCSLSVRDSIETCIDICSIHNIKIMNIFKNIDKLGDMLSKYKTNSVLENLASLVSYHSDLAEALQNVMDFSKNNKDEFQLILQEF